jgi:hypothetical protein
MRKQDVLSELESLAQKLGYKVRYEKGTFIGGDCRVKQDKIMVINKFLPIEGKIATLARTLGRVGVENVFIAPEVRQVIDDALTTKETTDATAGDE